MIKDSDFLICLLNTSFYSTN
uniref:Uncharacterized protein n=1 Tax=Rhizophora mucronata TaxID=61149 RepID=A0A2P2MYX4_RHIMU